MTHRVNALLPDGRGCAGGIHRATAPILVRFGYATWRGKKQATLQLLAPITGRVWRQAVRSYTRDREGGNCFW